jgi:hypothetical protein
MIPGIGMLIRDDDRNQGSVPGDRSQKLMSINGSRAPRQAGGGRWPVVQRCTASRASVLPVT